MHALLNAYSKFAPAYAGFSTFTLRTTCYSSSKTAWRVSQSPTHRIPQVHNRKRFRFLGNIADIIFLNYLMKYTCKHPNKGAFKYFTMQFFKLVSKVETCIALAHAVEREERHWQEDEHCTRPKAEDSHQLPKTTQWHTGACQTCKFFPVEPYFFRFFSIFWCHMKP